MLCPHEALRKSALPAHATRSPLAKYCLSVLIALLVSLPASNHSLRPQEISPEDVVRVRTDLVTVPVFVSDSNGKRVFGLTQSHFLIRDEGQDAKVEFFSTGTEHVALAFLLDASGSAREYLIKQREAALALFSRFGPSSEIAVLRFSEGAEVAVPFTTEIAKARSGFDFPAVVGRHTAIFDAAAAAIRFFEQRKNDPTERRIIILTSDGLDTASTKKATEVIGRAREGGISFYVIHFPLFIPREGHLALRQTSKGFRELAEKTGGRYFRAGDVKLALDPNAPYDLSAVFKAIEEDLASQYLLGFYPREAARDGRPHSVAVTLKKNAPDYRVKTLRERYSLKHY